MEMRLTLLCIALVASVFMTSQAEAATRFGFGVERMWVGQDERVVADSTNGFGLRLSVEQELNTRWSVELALDGDFSLFADGKSLEAIGAYAKYKLSSTPSSFYLKAGPNYSGYSLREFKKSTEKSYGTGALAAVGWQYVGESNWGISLEAWYTKMGRDDAYGTTLTVSYGFNWFN